MKNESRIRTLYELPEGVDEGFLEQDVTSLENRLIVKLPQALKNYYLTFGKNEDINFVYNRLIGLKEVDFTKDRYLVVFEENQNVVCWGIKKADLSQENPPVWGNYGSEDDPDWHLESKSTDDFFLLMAIYNGVMGGLRYNANFLNDVSSDVVSFVTSNWNIVSEISNEQQKVYTNDFREVLSLSFSKDGNCHGIFIGTKDQDRFDYLLDVLNVNWSYVSYEDEDEAYEDEETKEI